MKEVSFLERVTVRLASSELIIFRCCPSITIRVSLGLRTLIVRLESAGNTIERKTLKAHMGVRTKAFMHGSRTGPPAESE